MLFNILFIIGMEVCSCACYKLNPVIRASHAEVLDDLIRLANNGTTVESTFTRFLFDDDYTLHRSNENLDIDTLDLHSLRKIINKLKTKQQSSSINEYKAQRRNIEANASGVSIFGPKVFDMMKQSIYMTRYRINDTTDIRAAFADDSVYQIALLVGSLDHILMKADIAMSTLEVHMKKTKTYFIWYLILYEKMLTYSVDVGYIVQRVFEIYTIFKDIPSNDTTTAKP